MMRWFSFALLLLAFCCNSGSSSPASPSSPSSTPTADESSTTKPLRDLSASEVQALLSMWGFSPLISHFHGVDGNLLALLQPEDIAHAIESDSALGIPGRLAFRGLAVKLRDVLGTQHGLVSVAAPPHTDVPSNNDNDNLQHVFEAGNELKRQLTDDSSSMVVRVAEDGALDWSTYSAPGSGIWLRYNGSGIQFGSQNEANASVIFRAQPGQLAVKGGLAVEGHLESENLAALAAQVAELVAWRDELGDGPNQQMMTNGSMEVSGNLTVGGHLEWRYKQTHLHAYLDKIDQLADAVLDIQGLFYNSESNPAGSCLQAQVFGSASGVYWIQTSSMSSPAEMYCDMDTDDGGWTLVGVALVDFAGESGWNDDDGLNLAYSYSLDNHWHQTASIINDLLLAGDSLARALCFDSNNNFHRYWYGTGTYSWEAVSDADSSTDGYYSGTSYDTVWASHHYGLVSGDDEYTTLITSHSGDEWACGGIYAAGGEGYTGRGGDSSFRFWVR